MGACLERLPAAGELPRDVRYTCCLLDLHGRMHGTHVNHLGKSRKLRVNQPDMATNTFKRKQHITYQAANNCTTGMARTCIATLPLLACLRMNCLLLATPCALNGPPLLIDCNAGRNKCSLCAARPRHVSRPLVLCTRL